LSIVVGGHGLAHKPGRRVTPTLTAVLLRESIVEPIVDIEVDRARDLRKRIVPARDDHV
jgi:hypothetical protein